MIAERRYSARHPVALTVHILYEKRRFCGAQASNLSNQGMHLTLQNLTLPNGTLVELEFDCLGRDWLIEAVVAHRSGSGVGLMFREPQPALYQGMLQGLILSDRARNAEAPRSTVTAERPLLARH